MVVANQSGKSEGKPGVSLTTLHGTATDFCGCGEPKRVSHKRCKKCRDKASRNTHLEAIRCKDRIRKKVIATHIPRVITITRKSQELSALAAYARTLPEDQCEMVLKCGGWSVRSLDKPTVRDVPEAPVRIKVSSRPQVERVLRNEKAKRLSAVLGELARAEACKREKRNVA